MDDAMVLSVVLLVDGVLLLDVVLHPASDMKHDKRAAGASVAIGDRLDVIGLLAGDTNALLASSCSAATRY